MNTRADTLDDIGRYDMPSFPPSPSDLGFLCGGGTVGLPRQLFRRAA